MRVLFRRFAAFSCFFVCVGIVLGFAGGLHPFADSVSLLRMPLGGMCLVALVFPVARILRYMLAVAGFAALMTTVPLLMRSQPPGSLILYTKNLLYRNDEWAALAADIRATDADVVTLQEVSQRNDPFLMILKDAYPFQHLCRFTGWSGVAVLSKTQFVRPPRCSDVTGVAAAQIENDGYHIWVASVHLPWPYPYRQNASTQAAVALFDALEGPLVIGGDFNIFPWASSVRQIRQASETKIAGPLRPTFKLYGAPLFLDHVYAPGGGSLSYRGLLGSDHLGVLAHLALES
ncbi:endonuclease/exonuclease/phosphatase family protein [Yoonia maritima]|uniref:endonuclease/exonuclease/phosphatase family protein n=1 Tax=Yoonia maritima TaxID=1435347 RepID=UPI000D0F48F0|nr:endonuclease/exonuclease/phosphatase family protein [Yoonia maritima]